MRDPAHFDVALVESDPDTFARAVKRHDARLALGISSTPSPSMSKGKTGQNQMPGTMPRPSSFVHTVLPAGVTTDRCKVPFG